jgi:alkaline phosphatase
MFRRAALVTGSLLVTLTLTAGTAAAHGPGPRHSPVRNVILMIDDGAGANTHRVGSLYDTGKLRGEAYNRFPFRVATTTYSYGDVAVGACGDLVGYDRKAARTTFDYVLMDPTDSAAAATAIATGTKTYDKAIGVDCAGQSVENLVEAFEARGRSTGVVTSVPFDHATPAAFVAHWTERDAYTVLGHQMIWDSGADVIMGAGSPNYSKYGAKQPGGTYTYVTKDDWLGLKAGTAGGDANGDGTNDPFTLVESREAFQALMTGDTPSRVFGMAQVRNTLQEQRMRPGEETNPAPFTLPFLQTVPTLSEMANGALNVLDNDEEGFFLMIEGGATDWAAHDNRPGLLIEEELAFDRAVEAVMAWVEANSNWHETMVIVTSDHETGYITGPGSGQTADGPVWNPVVSNGAGAMPDFVFNSINHTNSLVPTYVKGAPASLLGHIPDGKHRGGPHRYADNTDIHKLVLLALGK